ncbi:MAG: YdcF family protein [Deltaproteobacteria bacterium]|nr:YdcF family protein [Deltaproteobacteria bacterium]
MKKIIAPLFYPLSLCLGFLLVSIFLLCFTRRRRTGKLMVCLGFVLLALFSYAPLPDIALESLECRYAPLVDVSQFSDVKWVVVLGGGHNSDSKFPATLQLSESSLSRLVEGVRIHGLLPESCLVLSGGAVFDPVSEAEVMARAAGVMGVGGDGIVLEELSRDTGDQARLVHEIVGDERFILVTSASHMPRSMVLFRKSGMEPIPAPTDYRVKKRQRLSPGVFFPNAGNLRKMEMVFHEYLGLCWTALTHSLDRLY